MRFAWLGIIVLTVWSAAAGADDRVYKVGLISALAPPSDDSPIGQALIQRLASHGDVPGKTVVFERKGAQAQVAKLPGLVDELLADKVDAILAFSYPAALAAARATKTVPIVIMQAGDPVRTGMVTSLARPGGNITGISEVAEELSAKRLEVLKEAMPSIKRVAMLWNADDLGMSLREKAADAAAQRLGLAVESLGVRAPDDFDDAFRTMDKDPPDAVLMVADALTTLNRKRVFDYAAAHKLPAIYEYDNYVKDGGLMSYGPDLTEMAASAADLLDRVLHGAKPEDLPLEQPSRFVFALNLKTMKALGLDLPQSVVIRADEVIE